MLCDQTIVAVEMYNANGSLVYSKLNNPTSTLIIPMQERSSGIYHIRYTINNIVYTYSVVRQ